MNLFASVRSVDNQHCVVITPTQYYGSTAFTEEEVMAVLQRLQTEDHVEVAIEGTHSWLETELSVWRHLFDAITATAPRLRGIRVWMHRDGVDDNWLATFLQCMPEGAQFLSITGVLSDFPKTFACIPRFQALRHLEIEGHRTGHVPRGANSVPGFGVSFVTQMCNTFPSLPMLRNLHLLRFVIRKEKEFWPLLSSSIRGCKSIRILGCQDILCFSQTPTGQQQLKATYPSREQLDNMLFISRINAVLDQLDTSSETPRDAKDTVKLLSLVDTETDFDLFHHFLTELDMSYAPIAQSST